MKVDYTKLAILGLVGFFSPGILLKMCYDKHCEIQQQKRLAEDLKRAAPKTARKSLFAKK